MNLIMFFLAKLLENNGLTPYYVLLKTFYKAVLLKFSFGLYIGLINHIDVINVLFTIITICIA